MTYQTGKNLEVSFGVEPTFNAAAPTTGATRFRLNSGAGLKFARTVINPGEVRSDGQTAMARMGGRSVTGTYPTDISVGSFDDLIAAVLRGTWVAGTDPVTKQVLPSSTPVRRSFAFEQYYADMDQTELYTGNRISSMKVMAKPNAMATIEFGVVGADMQVLAAAASPYFTTPALSTSIGLVTEDGVIQLGGAPVLDFTGCDFTVDLKCKGEPVIGSAITPDVFESNMVISGTITALVKDLARVTSSLAETELALSLKLVEPAPSTGFITFLIPRLKLDIPTKTLGNDGALIATIPFVVGKDETLGGMIEVQTSAAL